MTGADISQVNTNTLNANQRNTFGSIWQAPSTSQHINCKATIWSTATTSNDITTCIDGYITIQSERKCEESTWYGYAASPSS